MLTMELEQYLQYPEVRKRIQHKLQKILQNYKFPEALKSPSLLRLQKILFFIHSLGIYRNNIFLHQMVLVLSSSAEPQQKEISNPTLQVEHSDSSSTPAIKHMILVILMISIRMKLVLPVKVSLQTLQKILFYSISMEVRQLQRLISIQKLQQVSLHFLELYKISNLSTPNLELVQYSSQMHQPRASAMLMSDLDLYLQSPVPTVYTAQILQKIQLSYKFLDPRSHLSSPTSLQLVLDSSTSMDPHLPERSILTQSLVPESLLFLENLSIQMLSSSQHRRDPERSTFLDLPQILSQKHSILQEFSSRSPVDSNPSPNLPTSALERFTPKTLLHQLSTILIRYQEVMSASFKV